MSSKSVAIMTSGGDAPGMNAFVRAAVLTCLHQNVKVYGVYEGYQGLIDGGKYIKEMTSDDVDLILSKGGTVLGTARCLQFRQREGRLVAAKNLVDRGISHLVVCGGDGSLTGANLFQAEWTSLIDELLVSGRITEQKHLNNKTFEVVGCVGSIDNDLVYNGELTIGTDTALHRIVECIDAVIATASSHQRTFICEVMGRNCGYLALGAAMACGADYVLIPEAPPLADNWTDLLIEKLKKRRRKGKRSFLIIMAEGAVDKFGKRISSDDVKDILEKTNFFDVRITVLGHVQRGGVPSAYDRINGTITGAACVQYLLQKDLVTGNENQISSLPENHQLNAPSNSESLLVPMKGTATRGFQIAQEILKNIVPRKMKDSQIIGLRGLSVTYDSLVHAVAKTQAVEKSARALDFDTAINLRGHGFAEDYQYHLLINGTMSRLAERKAILSHMHRRLSLKNVNVACLKTVKNTSSLSSGSVPPSPVLAPIQPSHHIPLVKNASIDKNSNSNNNNNNSDSADRRRVLAILNIGAPAAGMNCTVRAAVRYALNFDYTVLGVEQGVDGLIKGRIVPLEYMSVDQWALEGGSILGTNRVIPTSSKEWDAIFETLKGHCVDALLVVGGFEGLIFLKEFDARENTLLAEKRDLYLHALPICYIPATISNNVPGTQVSIGADTALNAIVESIDKAKTSAYSSTHRVFIIETQGGYCGFLALLGSLAAGVDFVFTREEGMKMADIMKAVHQIKSRMRNGKKYSIIVKSEWASPTYTINFLSKVLAEESEGLYEVRKLVLGHLCQGLYPSPLDRIRACKLAARAFERLDLKIDANQGTARSTKVTENFASIELVGFHDGLPRIIDIYDVFASADFEYRLPKSSPWLLCSLLLKRLASSHNPAHTAMIR